MVELLSIPLKNEPGAFAHVATSLGNAGLNIEGVIGDAHTEIGVVRLLVDDPDRGFEVLEKAGHPVQKVRGVKLMLGNEPGALGRALQALGRANVNVELVFGTCPNEDSGEILFLVDDEEAAEKALADL